MNNMFEEEFQFLIGTVIEECKMKVAVTWESFNSS